MKYFITICLSLTLIGCEKYECVKDVAPEMIGDWVHYSANDGFHIIYIQKNGRGWMWGENDHGNTIDAQRRGWYVKDDILHHSRLGDGPNFAFTIDEYPTISASEIATPFDTIPAGNYYMVLDGRTYRKKN